VDTTDGTRVADVAWISQERLAPYKEVLSLPIGPEICVEILSKSNTREEMQGKMQLYFAAGTREVWLCDKSGELEFYAFDLVGPIPRSRLCPEFPLKLNLG
jgi:Uma2 family endonuclease